MNLPQIHSTALDRWLLAQALFWTVVIPTVAWWIEASGVHTMQFVVWGSSMLFGHLILVRVLAAGGTVADWVTILRGALLLSCCGLAWTSEGLTWILWVGLGIALLGDLLDGWCARRFGGSDAGAMLDMETDQASTLCLAFLLHAAGVGPWVYLLPGFRYGYILLMRLLRVSAADPKPCDGDNRRARLICAVMMLLLFVAVTPGVNTVVANSCAGIPVVLLAFSYGSDIRFLLRRRRVERVG